MIRNILIIIHSFAQLIDIEHRFATAATAATAAAASIHKYWSKLFVGSVRWICYRKTFESLAFWSPSFFFLPFCPYWKTKSNLENKDIHLWLVSQQSVFLSLNSFQCSDNLGFYYFCSWKKEIFVTRYKQFSTIDTIYSLHYIHRTHRYGLTVWKIFKIFIVNVWMRCKYSTITPTKYLQIKRSNSAPCQRIRQSTKWCITLNYHWNLSRIRSYLNIHNTHAPNAERPQSYEMKET